MEREERAALEGSVTGAEQAGNALVAAEAKAAEDQSGTAGSPLASTLLKATEDVKETLDEIRAGGSILGDVQEVVDGAVKLQETEAVENGLFDE